MTTEAFPTEPPEIVDQANFAGAPGPFAQLWTPHRMVYINGESKPSTGDEEQCPFCRAPKLDDRESLVVYRGESAYVIMNLFPYNSGHLLVCPYRHVSLLYEATPAERNEITELAATAMQVLKKVANPDGFNLGFNQGTVAGAGIAAHLHQHVVPRWMGDANFFPLIAQTKAIPKLLLQARDELAEAWPVD